MSKLNQIAVAMGLSLGLVAVSQAAFIYTSEAAFLAAAGGGLSLESFENPSQVTGTSVKVADATVTCSTSQYCPGFFGVRQIGNATDGRQTVYFATPSAMVFTFNTAITAFGINVMDLGTTGGTTNLTIDYQNGSQQIFTNFTGGGVLFAGVIDSNAFTQVTFSATRPNDGIDFDRMQYKTGGTVPEPSSAALALLALAGLGALRRRSA